MWYESMHFKSEARKSILRLPLAILTTTVMMLAVVPCASPRSSASSCQSFDLVGEVNGSRLISTVTDLQNFGSRAFFTNSMWNASIYIHDKLAELGLWVRYQDFQSYGYAQRNIIAVLNGTDPSAPQFLFGAHYDSITSILANRSANDTPLAPGADDDASGVAATIELATVLHESRFNSTVKFVAFAAEETGLNGSSAFVQEELANGVLYADTTIMDMIGYRATGQNGAFIFRDNRANTMSESVSKAVAKYGLNLSLTIVDGTAIGWSDHYPFWKAGYPSMLVIENLVNGSLANPFYHSDNDTVATLSQDQMTVISKALLGGFLELQTPHEQGRRNVAVLIILAVVATAAAIVISVHIISRRKGVQ